MAIMNGNNDNQLGWQWQQPEPKYDVYGKNKNHDCQGWGLGLGLGLGRARVRTSRELLGNQVSFLVNFTILKTSPVCIRVRVRVRVMFSQPKALPFLNFFFASLRVIRWNWVCVTLVRACVCVCVCVRARVHCGIYIISPSIPAAKKIKSYWEKI